MQRWELFEHASHGDGVGGYAMSGRVDAPRAREMIESGAQLVDVLPSSVFEQEHLPGAQNVPLETMDAAAVGHLDRQRALIVYCFDQH